MTDKLLLDFGGNVFDPPPADENPDDRYDGSSPIATQEPPVQRAPDDTPGVTTSPSYDLRSDPDPLQPVPSRPEWHDKPEQKTPPAPGWFDGAMEYDRAARRDINDYTETFLKGVTEGAGQGAIYSAKGTLADIDIMTDPSRRSEAMFLPTLRSISQIKDATERQKAESAMREGVRYMLSDQRDRETVYRLMEDVKNDPTFLPKAEKELDDYLINSQSFRSLTDAQVFLSQTFKVKPEFQGGVTHSIAQGLGQYASMVLASVIGRPFGIASGLTQTQGQQIDDALKEGVEPQTALEASVVALVPGATDYIPLEYLLRVPGLGRGLGGILKRAAAQGLIEGTQEGAQQVLQNAIAQYLYRPEQEIRDGIASSAGVGGAVGVIAEFTTHMLGLRHRFFSPAQIKALDDGTAAPFDQALAGLVGPEGERGPAAVGAVPPAPGTAPMAPRTQAGVAPEAQPATTVAPAAQPGEAAPAPAPAPPEPTKTPTQQIAANLSASTGTLAGIEKLQKAASEGDTEAGRLLSDVAYDSLAYLTQGIPSAKIDYTRTEGLYGGSVENGLALRAEFDEEDLPSMLAAFTKFAANFNQEQVHVRQPTEGIAGDTYEDGSYNTPVVRYHLKGPLPRARIEQIAKEAGLSGFTATDDYLETYYAGDPKDEIAIEQFHNAVGRAAAALGEDAASFEEATARLWAYGKGGIAFPQVDSELRPGQTDNNATARRIAERLARTSVEPAQQAAEVTDTQRSQQRVIAAAYEAMPVNDLSNPNVRRAYNELADEVTRQYDALPIKVELRTDTAEPYASSDAMRQDVLQNNHLSVFATKPETFGPKDAKYDNHPLLKDSGRKDINGKPMLVNDLLRAVHDYFAHTLSPVMFGPKGEEAAWKNHMAMTRSPWARWALTSETRGQNSWVNFRPGAEALAVKDRPFAEQKVGLLPLVHVITGSPEGDAEIAQLANEVGDNSVRPDTATGAQPAMDISKIEQIEQHERTVGPVWVSGLRRIVDGFKQQSGPAKQWMGMIKNAPGVKPGELEATGLMDWLAAHPDVELVDGVAKPVMVSKGDVLDYIAANQLVINEVVRRAVPPKPQARNDSSSEYVEDASFDWGDWKTDEPDENYLDERAREYVRDNETEVVDPIYEEMLDEQYVEALSDTAAHNDAVAAITGGFFDKTYHLPDDRGPGWPELVAQMEATTMERYNAQQALHQEEQLPIPGVEPLPKPMALLDVARKVFEETLGNRIRDLAEEKAVDQQIEQEREYHYQDDEAPQTSRLDYGGHEFMINQAYGEWSVYDQTVGGSLERWIRNIRRPDQPQIESAIQEYMLDEGFMRSREQEEDNIDEEDQQLADTGGQPAVTGPSPDEAIAAIAKTPKWTQYQALKGGDLYTELTLTLPNVEFEHSHWPERGVVGHVRFAITKDADGNTVLLLLEMQSDLHQAGREKGYATPEVRLRRGDLTAEIGNLDTKLQETRDRYDDLLRKARIERLGGTGTMDEFIRKSVEAAVAPEYATVNVSTAASDWRQKTTAEILAANPDLNAASREIIELQNQIARLGGERATMAQAVADAPFKKTWEELILSRMIRWAAERGIQTVAWSPGRYQIDLWQTSMRQNVSSIEWITTNNAMGAPVLNINTRGSAGPTALQFVDGKLQRQGDDFQDATVEDVFGRDIAAKIAGAQSGTFSGDDISVGGKGFKEAYDKIMVNAANKLIKKWGAKVTVTELPNVIGAKAQFPARPAVAGDLPRPGSNEPAVQVWSFPITDKMREQALGGMDISYMDTVQPPRQPYPGERVRPAAGVPDRPKARVVTPSQIVSDFKKTLNLTLRKGVEGARRTVRGIYKWKVGVARVRDMTDVTDVLHEGGHALHDAHPGIDRLTYQYAPDLMAVANAYYPAANQITDVTTRRREGFATMFHLYVQNPMQIESTHPAVVKAFDEWLRTNMPKQHKALMKLRKDIDDYLATPSRALTAEQIVSGKPETNMEAVRRNFRDGTVLENFAALSNTIYKNSFDNLHPITVALRVLKTIGENNLRTAVREAGMTKAQVKQQIAKFDVRGTENPVVMAQLGRNGYQQGQDWLMNGPTAYRTANRVAPSLSEVYVDLFKGRTKMISRAREQRTKTDFDHYLVMRRALEETGNFEQTKAWVDAGSVGPGPPVKRYRSPIGQARGEITAAIRSLEAEYPHFRNAAVKYYKFLNAVWQYKYDAGLMTKEEYEGGLRIKNYAPVRRKMDAKATGSMTGKARSQTGSDNLVRGFRGSVRDIISPMESATQIAYETAALVHSNQTKRALVSVAEMAGTGRGAVVEEIPATEVKAMRAKLLDLVKQGQNQLNVSQELDDLLDAGGITLDDFIDELIPDTTMATIWGRTALSAKGEPVMFVRDAGKVRGFYVNDDGPLKGLHEALTSGPVQIPPDFAEAILAKAGALFRAGVTTFPPYAVANAIRDTFQYAVYYPGFIPGWTTAKGVWHVLRQDRIARAFAQANGMVGGVNAAALDTIKVERELKTLRQKGFIIRHFASWRDIAKLIEIPETAARVGVFGIAYRRALRDGLDHYDAASEAAFTAQDVMNFGRHGARMVRTKRFLTFINANLQALDKQGRALLGGEGSLALWRKQVKPLFTRDGRLPLTKGEGKELKKALYGWTAMGVMALVSALVAMDYWDDEEYNEFSPYISATRWKVKVNNEWWLIPKPYALAIVANATEAALDAWGKDDPTAFARFREGVLYTTVPPFENPAIKTGYELAANRNIFTGRDIVSEPERPNFMQYDAYTSELSKSLARMTAEATGTEGMSPQQMDHVITGLGASWGRALLRGSDFMRENAPQRTWQDNPFTSYFIKDWKRGATSATAFYEAVSKENGKWVGVYGSYKSLMDSGSEQRAVELLDMYDDNTKAYALLNYHFDTKMKRLHPIRSAEAVVGSINELMKELLVGQIKLDKGKGRELVLAPDVRRTAIETMSLLRLREMRNALVVLGVEGWGNKKVLTTSMVFDQLYDLSPELALELELRIGERAYSFDRVRELWPKVKDELLANGPKANLIGPYSKALAGGRRYWTEGDAP